MTTGSKLRVRLLAAVIWILVIGGGLAAWHYFVRPLWKQKLVADTSSQSKYRHEVKIAADAFSGYAFFRSEPFRKEMGGAGIKVTIVDDKADYAARMKALSDGSVPVAVFTLDAFLKTGASLGEFPATTVFVIDETKGADAIVGYQDAVKSVSDLNHETARIVFTPESPSEFISRVAVGNFYLPRLPEKWYEHADGAQAVLERLRAGNRTDKRAYALWEPYVSQALSIPGVNVLLDSSKLKGYIVDVLVVERNYLREHTDVAKQLVEAYFRSMMVYEDRKDLVDLIKLDAQATGQTLTQAQAEKIADGIQWKNVMENYAHFGVVTGSAVGGTMTLEDIIPRITQVLVKTKAVPQDPLNGRPTTIIYDGLLRDLYASNFHPGKSLDLIEGVGPGTADLPKARTDVPLAALASTAWSTLTPVAAMQVESITFTRGTSKLSVQSERELSELARTLTSFSGYYVDVVGHARAEGDLSANRRLAQERADAAARYLVSRGISNDRIRFSGAAPSGDAQEVEFRLLQKR